MSFAVKTQRMITPFIPCFLLALEQTQQAKTNILDIRLFCSTKMERNVFYPLFYHAAGAKPPGRPAVVKPVVQNSTKETRRAVKGKHPPSTTKHTPCITIDDASDSSFRPAERKTADSSQSLTELDSALLTFSFNKDGTASLDISMAGQGRQGRRSAFLFVVRLQFFP
jgi:hypothetical protein